MKTIRIGIIGVGQIGKAHLNAYSTIPNAEVVAACDIDTPELTRVAEKFNIPSTYFHFEDLLARTDLDCVDVCLHNNLHSPVTQAVLRSGKNAYCEKPMAGSYRDAVAMLAAAKETGKMLHIQLSTLYAPETKAAIKLIDDGQLGHIYHARSTGFRRRGRPFVDGYGREQFVQKAVAAGGALYDMGVYHISRMLYLLGMPAVERVSGKIYQEMDMDARRREFSGYSVEELGLGFVKFAGGLTLDIIEAWAISLNNFEGSSIVGSRGGIRLDPFSFHSTVCDMDMNSTFDLGAANGRWHDLYDNPDAYDSSQHHWIAAQQGRVPLLPTAEIALQTMLISESIYLSDRLGREVTAEETLTASQSSALDPHVEEVAV